MSSPSQAAAWIESPNRGIGLNAETGITLLFVKAREAEGCHPRRQLQGHGRAAPVLRQARIRGRQHRVLSTEHPNPQTEPTMSCECDCQMAIASGLRLDLVSISFGNVTPRKSKSGISMPPHEWSGGTPQTLNPPHYRLYFECISFQRSIPKMEIKSEIPEYDGCPDAAGSKRNETNKPTQTEN